MSQLDPGKERRVRRFGFAGKLAVLAAALILAGAVLRDLYGQGAPRWLWLVPFASGYALWVVSLVIIISLIREVRHLLRQ
jgi:hypothetical protein